jgi:tetratricopeptide (TPR) repeat protein
MGLFDRLFGSRGEPTAPDDLRRALFDAVAAGNQARLKALCETHEAVIAASFEAWTRVPEAFRTPEKLQWYGPGLIAVARHFAEARGRPELMQRLASRPEGNPLVGWQRSLAEAGRLIAEGEYEAAVARLRETLETTAELQGSGADTYRPITYGRLGEGLLQLRDAEAAREATVRALAGCEATGDAAGIVAYLGNLHEIDRYRGDAAGAATALERLADAVERLGDPRRAAAHRRQASIVRAGEPLCRVVAELEGERYELSDLPRVTGSVRFIFQRNRLTLRRCEHAVEQGVAAAERGELEPALAWFARAASADPFDPWPSYHAGMAQLELRRYDDAVDSYRTVEALAPGWYHGRSTGWLAQQLAAGALDHDTFQVIRQLEDGRPPPAEAIVLATRALQRTELGVLRLALGSALDKQGRHREAEDAFRRGLASAEEPDLRTRLLVALANRTADPQAKSRSLHEAIELAGNLVAAATATVMLAAAPPN